MQRSTRGCVHRGFVTAALLLPIATAARLPSLAGPPIAPQTTPVAANVVLFTLDGLRWQELFGGADETLLNEEAGGVADVDAVRVEFWRATRSGRRSVLMPFFWEVLAPAGQVYGNPDLGSEVRVTNGRNFSYPGYHEMLAGYPDDRIDSNAKRLNPNPNVLEWVARQSGFEGRVAAFTAWDVFPYILNEPRAGIPVNSGWELLDHEPPTGRQRLLNDLMRTTLRVSDEVRSDELTFFAALEYLSAARPRVLFISLDGTDAGAHSRRYDRYLQAARAADDFLRILWGTLQTLDQYRGKTTLLVTTDHGRGDAPDGWRGHGADVAGSELMWLAAMGPGVTPRGEREHVAPLTQSQVAASIAALLGLDYRQDVPRAAPPITAILR